MRVWQYRNTDEPSFSDDVLAAAKGSKLLARLLYNRGLTSTKDIQAFLELDQYQPTSGLELPDMQKGVDRVLKAIDQQESILIFGDFDVDGITGTSVLYQTLKYLNAKVSYYIPDRQTEGHGLNVTALCRLVSTRQVKLVITTDTGITNFAEVSLLNGLNVDTIVTDHHELPENLPPSYANINPQLLTDANHPLALMAGVGVAYKLCELLLKAKQAPIAFAESLLDLVAIGTVADLASLHRENRYLVYRGIQVLNQRQRLGVNEILQQAGTKPDAVLNSETVGFTIGPRLNALGRLENAQEAVELLTTQDTERARIIAAHLEHLNRKRQDLCEQMFLEAERHLSATGGLDGRRAIILGSPDWNPGIIGIIASRLIDKYHVPTFMMNIDESKGEVRCSARSIPGFHLHDALSTLQHYFIGFGGHSGAAGFSLKLDRLESFKRDLYSLTNRMITEEQMRPIINVDFKLEGGQLNTHLVELVSYLAPFGQDNPSPRFVAENMSIGAQRPLGTDGRHLKLILTTHGLSSPLEALIWNFASRDKLPAVPHHFVFVPELNTFNNTTKLQLIINDYRAAQEGQMSPKIEANQITTTPSEKATLSASNTSTELSDEPILKWIDHRSRDSVDSFIGQLMLPLQDSRTIILYHEGQAPNIPFLSADIICHRHTLRAASELVLWDLPPEPGVLHHILKEVNPQVIHLVGGKYQTVPANPNPKDFMKVIYQRLSRLQTQQNGQMLEVNLTEWAAQLSTTQTVLTNGLLVLGRLNMVQLTVPNEDTPHILHIKVQAPNGTGEAQKMSQYLEFLTFQQALKEVGQFRHWLLTSPLEKIKSFAMVEAYHSSNVGSLPQEKATHDLIRH